MGSEAVVDVIKKILSEKVTPKNGTVILCLAKTDKEKQVAKDEADSSDEDGEGGKLLSAKQRAIYRIWTRQGYKKPYAAAGVRPNPLLLTTKLTRSQRRRQNGPAPTLGCVEAEKAREGRLRAEATRGVVRLFNTIREQQRAVQLQIGGSGVTEARREKVLSSLTTHDFLDRLSAAGTGAKEKRKKKQEQQAADLKELNQTTAK